MLKAVQPQKNSPKTTAAPMSIAGTNPAHPRPFKTPLVPWVPLAAVLSCTYLMIQLPWVTWARFVIWLAVGIVFYYIYGYRHSHLRQRA